MFKNLVVPIDLGHLEKAPAMLEAAKRLSDESAKVTVVNVVADIPSSISSEFPAHAIQNAAQSARSKLTAITKAAGMSADVQLRSGRAHHGIVSLADEIGADLILIASHRPGLGDYVLGSTAASVVRHAKCSVLVQR